MELKAVCTVPMCDLIFESLRQINDLNGLKRASLDAHTASDTEHFRNPADFTRGSHINALLSGFVDGAGLEALLGAFLGFALVRVDNCDS